MYIKCHTHSWFAAWRLAHWGDSGWNIFGLLTFFSSFATACYILGLWQLSVLNSWRFCFPIVDDIRLANICILATTHGNGNWWWWAIGRKWTWTQGKRKVSWQCNVQHSACNTTWLDTCCMLSTENRSDGEKDAPFLASISLPVTSVSIPVREVDATDSFPLSTVLPDFNLMTVLPVSSWFTSMSSTERSWLAKTETSSGETSVFEGRSTSEWDRDAGGRKKNKKEERGYSHSHFP